MMKESSFKLTVRIKTPAFPLEKKGSENYCIPIFG